MISLIGLLFLVLPLAVVVLFSSTRPRRCRSPYGLLLRWYQQVLSSAEFLNATRHSLIVASGVAVGTLIAGSLAPMGSAGRPSAARTAGAALLPADYLARPLPRPRAPRLLRGLDIKLSLVTVAIGHFVYAFPYFLLVVKAALDRMDEALEEAAADLGADPWTVFRRVTLPQMWPVLMGATALAFALSLDEFVITFFVIGSQSTLPLYIWLGLRRTIDPSINTVSSLLMLASLLIFVVAFLFTLRGRARRFAEMPMPPPAQDARVSGKHGRPSCSMASAIATAGLRRCPTSRSRSRTASSSACWALGLRQDHAASHRGRLRTAVPGTRASGRSGHDGAAPHRRPLNTVFQRPSLFPHLDVGENVAFVASAASAARRDRAPRARGTDPGSARRASAAAVTSCPADRCSAWPSPACW